VHKYTPEFNSIKMRLIVSSKLTHVVSQLR